MFWLFFKGLYLEFLDRVLEKSSVALKLFT